MSTHGKEKKRHTRSLQVFFPDECNYIVIIKEEYNNSNYTGENQCRNLKCVNRGEKDAPTGEARYKNNTQ